MILLLALILTSVSALLVAADAALLALPLESKVVPSSVESRREHHHRALNIARVATLLGAAAATGAALDGWFSGWPRIVVMLSVLVAALVVAETLPRAIGDALPERTLTRLLPLVRVVDALVWVIVRTEQRLENAVRRVVDRPEEDESVRRTTDVGTFQHVLESGPELPEAERAMLNRVFTMGEVEVRDLMVPRVDVIGISSDTPWSEVLDRVRSAEHARFPVYDASIDDVIGVLFAKDVLAATVSEVVVDGEWSALVRPASFIPDSKSAEAQLRDFKAQRSHIAIVVDEYGGTSGIITLEDILEEIVGDIRDEHDVEEPEIESEEGRRYWVSARVPLEALSEALGQRFEHDDVSTVGGLIYEELGRVPRAGEELMLDGFRVVVERMKRRRVERVYFERQEALTEQRAR